MSERSGKSFVIIFIILVVVVISAGSWYFMVYQPEQATVEKARQEQLAKVAAEKKAAELAAQNKLRYNQLILDGDSAFEQEDWETAHARYTEASALFPNEQYPKDQLVLVNEKLDAMAKIAAGFIETIPSPTNRYYIIVSSSVDDDLAVDYATKLANEGNSVMIIEHNYNALPFFGVSLGDYDTQAQAEAALPLFSQYTDEAWVLKY